MDTNTRFKNRQEVGQKLADKLEKYRGMDAVVYGLPRGGVIVADEVAKHLGLPLDLIFVRKIGHPFNPEFAIGAISESGHKVGDTLKFYDVNDGWLEREIERHKFEIGRRRELYLGGRPPVSAKDKIAIIVDDGIATGLTMLAAIEEIKDQRPKKIVVAVPVLSPDIVELIRSQTEELITLLAPDSFLEAVGAYYEEFNQVSDEEVVAIMKNYVSDQ
ncbi:MAG: phosphoribosyltransferase [Patescibacteria group bacterium]